MMPPTAIVRMSLLTRDRRRRWAGGWIGGVIGSMRGLPTDGRSFFNPAMMNSIACEDSLLARHCVQPFQVPRRAASADGLAEYE